MKEQKSSPAAVHFLVHQEYLPSGALIARRLPPSRNMVEAEVPAVLEAAQGVYPAILGQTERKTP